MDLSTTVVIRLTKFGIVGIFGIVINMLVLYMLTAHANVYYLIAAAVAVESAIIFNFIGNNIFTFRGSKSRKPMYMKFISFQILSLGTLIITLTILWILTSTFGIEWLLLWNLIAIGVAFIANFLLNSKYTWNDDEHWGVKL
jgi:dolichol-phosphate mannosyltransferase